MPRPRFEQLDAEKKDRILHAAAMEFADKGYEGASLNRILEKAQISKGAAYYYFHDKMDLYATVLWHFMEHVMEAVQFDLSAMTAESFWSRMEDLERSAFDQAFEQPWVMRLYRSVWKMKDNRKLTERLTFLEGFVQWIGALIARGQELGVVRTDLPTEVLIRLILAVDEVMDSWLAERIEEATPEEMRRLVGVAIGTIRRVVMPMEEEEEEEGKDSTTATDTATATATGEEGKG